MNTSPLYAQDAERTIFGALTDTKGEPLIGANVYVKGISTLGTITDFNGEFELSVPPKAKTLIFSYVGYATKEVTIKKYQEEYNVKLKAQVSSMR
ncbi:MAG: carboxypeptidase-like regulatory domain-containing protein [Lewinellaceae bacterium]|nr:carboxypeptidase-like regulatory domain-containing protein [Lewinellaceae bacterium]